MEPGSVWTQRRVLNPVTATVSRRCTRCPMYTAAMLTRVLTRFHPIDSGQHPNLPRTLATLFTITMQILTVELLLAPPRPTEVPLKSQSSLHRDSPLAGQTHSQCAHALLLQDVLVKDRIPRRREQVRFFELGYVLLQLPFMTS